jgi:hypothetical protein
MNRVRTLGKGSRCRLSLGSGYVLFKLLLFAALLAALLAVLLACTTWNKHMPGYSETSSKSSL